MKNVNVWRKSTTTKTTTDRHLDGLVVSSRSAQNKLIDDISTGWLEAVQQMVAVHQRHLFHQRGRPPTTSVSLLAVRLELERLSMSAQRCRQSDAVVDQEVSRLLCRPPSPRLSQTPALGRRRTKRRTAAACADTRDITSKSHQASSRQTEQKDKGRKESSLCRLQRHGEEDLKRPCLDFNKMQASQSIHHLRHLGYYKRGGYDSLKIEADQSLTLADFITGGV